MKLTFLGATHEVTGSCTLIEVNGRYGLVDCGMEQGIDVFVNAELPVAPSAIDFILLTHAHIDHSGKIPLLYKLGCTAPVYATAATCSLCDIMLRDCANIQLSEAEYQNRKNKRSGEQQIEPLYPGLPQEYEKRYGKKFEVISEENEALMGILRTFCKERGIVSDQERLSTYLKGFEDRFAGEQLRLAFG